MTQVEANNPKAYQRIKKRLFIGGILLQIVLLVLLILTKASFYFKSISFSLSGNFYISNLFYFLLFGSFFYVVFFPLDFYSGYVLEHKFNLSRQNFSSWFNDHNKKAFISSVFFAVLASGLYFFLKNYDKTWWIWFSVFYFIFSLFSSWLFPLVILPLFYKYKGIDNPVLAEKINSLASACGMKLKGIYSINFSKDTVKANAAVIGLGSSRRVIIADTLLSKFNNDEIISVVAHEFGHYKLKHIRYILIFSFLAGFLMLFIVDLMFRSVFLKLGLVELSDIAGFPLLALGFIILTIFFLPLQNGFSRFLEVEADIFCLSQTKNKEPFISMMENLAKQNLADKDPSLLTEVFLYDHPPISKRIKLAERYFDGI